MSGHCFRIRYPNGSSSHHIQPGWQHSFAHHCKDDSHQILFFLRFPSSNATVTPYQRLANKVMSINLRQNDKEKKRYLAAEQSGALLSWTRGGGQRFKSQSQAMTYPNGKNLERNPKAARVCNPVPHPGQNKGEAPGRAFGVQSGPNNNT